MKNSPEDFLMGKNEKKTHRFCFGPVPSRRLGRSLGIDILPQKTCNLNCIYCEVGETKDYITTPGEYFPFEEIIDEISEILRGDTPFDTLTFTASGEPTLHSRLGDLISYAKQWTQKPVAVLTNSTLFHLKEVRNNLLKADILLPSLDSAIEETFRKINRPAKGVVLNDIIRGLTDMRKEFGGVMWLEILFVDGFNDSDDEILRLKEVITEINPHKVQLNTIVRPPAVSWAKMVSMEKLKKIKDFFGEKGEIIVDFKPKSINIRDDITPEYVIDLLKRRPMRFYDMEMAFSLDKNRLLTILDFLSRQGKITTKIHNNEIFYFHNIGE